MLNFDFKGFLHKMLPTIQVLCDLPRLDLKGMETEKHKIFWGWIARWNVRSRNYIHFINRFSKTHFWETAILCNSFGNSYMAPLTWDFQMRDETSWCLHFLCFRTMATGSLGLNTVWMKRSGSTWWGREKYHGSDTPIWCKRFWNSRKVRKLSNHPFKKRV